MCITGKSSGSDLIKFPWVQPYQISKESAMCEKLSVNRLHSCVQDGAHSLHMLSQHCLRTHLEPSLKSCFSSPLLFSKGEQPPL